MSDRSEAARTYARRRWVPVLLHGIAADGKCTCKDRDKPGHQEKGAGKHPVDSAWQDVTEVPDPDVAAAQWEGWRAGHNIGVATGAVSNLFVLDIDNDEGRAWLKEQEATHGRLEVSCATRTGGGGFQLWFRWPEGDVDIRNSQGKLAPGVDVRGSGGQVVAPPSVSGKGPYSWLVEAPPNPAPQWLVDLVKVQAKEPRKSPDTPSPAAGSADNAPADPRLRRYAENAWQGEIDRLKKMHHDDMATYTGEPWNGGVFQVACNLLELANSEWTPYDMTDALQVIATYAPTDEGFTREDVDDRIESAIKKVGETGRPLPELRATSQSDAVAGLLADLEPPAAAPDGVDPATGEISPPARDWPLRTWDDLGNAQRFVDHFGRSARYVAEAEGWALYRGARWEAVKPNVVLGLAQALFDSHGILMDTEAFGYSNAAEPDEDSPRAKFEKWVGKQRSSDRMGACVRQAAGRPEMHASLNDFDARLDIFAAKNCAVDLRHGTTIPHSPDLLLMKQSPVEWDASAPCHGWQAFLDRVMPDVEQQEYLKRIVGYSLTGEIISQAFFIHYGSGANGKSVFLEVIRAVLGDYGQTIPRETLLAKKDSEHPTSLARMKGMRFLEVSETAPGRRLDEEVVKNLTGDANVTARFMGKDYFDYRPTGKIHYVTNHLPVLSDANSIWRRLHLVHWNVTIPEHEQDHRLAEKLIATELPGILAWAVRGAQAWYEGGLRPPQSMRDALAVYRQDSDIFGDFLRERTTRAEGAVTPLKDLYAAYEAWCFGSGIKKPMSRQAFSATLKERGLEPKRIASGMAFAGVALVAVHVDTSWASGL